MTIWYQHPPVNIGGCLGFGFGDVNRSVAGSIPARRNTFDRIGTVIGIGKFADSGSPNRSNQVCCVSF